MKNQLLTLLSIVFLVFSSCKKEEKDTTSNTSAPSNTFTLKKEGVPYTANQILVSRIDEDAVSVEARATPGQLNNSYGVIVRRSIQPGTYVLEDSESEYFALFHIQDEETMFGWWHGSLTVLSNDTVAKIMHCNFEMTLYNDEIDQYPEVTDGDFTVHYQ